MLDNSAKNKHITHKECNMDKIYIRYRSGKNPIIV